MRVGSNRKPKSISWNSCVGCVGDRLQAAHELAAAAAIRRRSPAELRFGQLGDRRDGRRLRRRLRAARGRGRGWRRQPRRLGPGDELAVGSVAALGGQRRGDVGQRLARRSTSSARRPPTPSGVAVTLIGGRRRQLERLVEVPPGQRLASPVVADRRRPPRAVKRDRVADPGERGADRKRLVDHLAAGVGRASSRWPARLPLSTDDTYCGLEPAQVARVVPVVEVPAEAFEAGRSWRASPRGARPSRRVPIQPKSRAVTVDSRYIPMFVGEVRCATTGVGIVLEVVGRQAVVLRTDERLEEPPRPAGDQAERLDVVVRQLLGGRLGGGQADPARDRRARAATAPTNGTAIQHAPASRARTSDGRGDGDRRPRRPSAGRTPRKIELAARPWPAPPSSTRAGVGG